MPVQPVLIDGRWRASEAVGSFSAFNPATGEGLGDAYPISSWHDCDQALDAAVAAAEALQCVGAPIIAAFLDEYAQRIEAQSEVICNSAHLETALPLEPRLRAIELPRTVNQLRQAASAVREGSWQLPTIDSVANIRSCYGPLAPIAVVGPNNFPLAFNAVSGGDFAAALAAGNPVIAKAHPAHPQTTKLLAGHAHEAAIAIGLPTGSIQLIYDMDPASGERLAADTRLGALAFTGSRAAGLRLKASADAAGKLIYLEMSSVNPVFILPAALSTRRAEIVVETVGSCLMASGQFCTSPNVLVLNAGAEAEAFLSELRDSLAARAPQPLLSARVREGLQKSVSALRDAGAALLTGGQSVEGAGYYYQNTLLRVDGKRFLESPRQLQTEAFGNATLAVVATDLEQCVQIARRIEGSLTGAIYSDAAGADDLAYASIAQALRPRVGRLLNDKMPTGVAVSSAMNHGGPFPATGHPGFTAVGFPAGIRRFAMLQCFDQVREPRLPACLRDQPPHDDMWRLVDGGWRRGPLNDGASD